MLDEPAVCIISGSRKSSGCGAELLSVSARGQESPLGVCVSKDGNPLCVGSILHIACAGCGCRLFRVPCCVSRVACCVLRVACCVLGVGCCVLGVGRWSRASGVGCWVSDVVCYLVCEALCVHPLGAKKILWVSDEPAGCVRWGLGELSGSYLYPLAVKKVRWLSDEPDG